MVIRALSAIFVLMVTHSIQSLRIEQIQNLLGTAQTDFVDLLKVAHERLISWGILKQGGGASPLTAVSNAKEILGDVVFAIIRAGRDCVNGVQIEAFCSLPEQSPSIRRQSCCG